MKRVIAYIVLLVSTSVLVNTLPAQNVIISEFVAANSRTLEDEDGDASDWIELYNAGDTVVDLNGWSLTDIASQPTRWRFPATNLPPNSFIVVFASNKDRKIPGRPLHTNFRLNAAPPEYLGLVRPDLSVASEFAPTFPVQVTDFSYGFPVTQTPVPLVTLGAAAKMIVPQNGDLGTTWASASFVDTSWTAVNNGIGFETQPLIPFGSVVIADSIAEFSGVQGSNGWFYGYYNRGNDVDGTYNQSTDFEAFPRSGTSVTLSPTNFWNGTAWDWFAGNPPWTELTSGGGHPAAQNGDDGAAIHWAIRRYISETNGVIRLSGILAAQSQNGTCGDGVIGRIIVDGQEVYAQTTYGESLGYSILVSVNVGSVIDFAIDPGTGNNDFCDTTTFTAIVRTMNAGAVVADSLEDWSVSGTQGENNWFYGYWDAVDDPAPAGYQATNFIAFPSSTGPHGAGNFWTGELWDWFDGEPPWTEISRLEATPNFVYANPPSTSDKSHNHWAIRRWISEVTGSLIIDCHFGKKQLGGDGVTVRILQNGINRGNVLLAANNFSGAYFTIDLPTVVAGDQIDFVVEHTGTGAPTAAIGVGDTVFFNATIYGTTTLSNQFASNVESAMRNVNASAYLRIPFNLENATDLTSLRLRLKYDDGFIAYLNGVEVASRNAPGAPTFSSAASGEHADEMAVQFEDFDLTNVRDLLQIGPNVLAIHGLNLAAGDGDFLIAAELHAMRPSVNTSIANYFTLPTPGAVNGVGTTKLGPLIYDVKHLPHEPADAEDLIVTARVSPTANPVDALRLNYRVMYAAEVSIPMFDDGAHHDGVAGDGLFGAIIPNTAYTNGQMVRYYVTATDSETNLSRLPPYSDPLNTEQYLGAVVTNPALTNPLPVLHWFVQTPASADTDAGTRCSIYWKGEFYDNVLFNLHGQSSRGFPKKSYDLDFTREHHFLYKDDADRVDDVNMLTTYPDKSRIRNILSYEIHGGGGNRSPHHWVIPIRVQQNSQFHGDWHLVENGDDGYLRRIGRDRNGALYKMYDTMTDANTAEKKTRRHEDRSDLAGMIVAARQTGAAFRAWAYDNVDVSEVIDYLAAMIITGNVDCCHKNYYVYRDTEGDGEWEMLPWDVDLSLGRNWQGPSSGNNCSCYWDDFMHSGNGLNVGGNATLVASLFNASNGPFLEMYRRRIRSLMDQMLQPTNTPPDQLKFEKRMDELLPLMAPDAALDLAKWTTFQGFPYGPTVAQGITNGPAYQTMADAIALMKTNYFPARRAFLYGNAAIPAAQPTNINILISAIDYNPSSGNQDQEYIMLRNTNSIYVDISNWAVTGAVRHVFQGGVVIPPNGTNFLVADKRAFRARTESPKGGEARYIEGPYEGQLSARGETFALVDASGRLVQQFTYAGNPTLAQQYLRITEIMYHPAKAPAGSLYTAEDFEYIELKNIGPAALDLTGVHFNAGGIEFNFTGSAVTNLNAGEYVLIVKNMAAFTGRYGPGLNVAGEYIGFLNNGGENLRLDDRVGEKILDFRYENTWYPITDGPGASLVIVNETAPYDTWGLKSSWRPSAYGPGSPGAVDPTPVAVAPVLVNEALTHTDFPFLDTIELYNPNATAANIGGWFISDDFNDPLKFRVPDGTVIPARSYWLFDEDDFNPNPGVPPSFSFSSAGDEAYIFSGDGTNLTGYVHGFAYAGAENGVTFGRYVDSRTNEHFVAQSTNTLGATNAYPKVGPVVISEIMYHPPDYDEDDNVFEEFIEIHNFSTNAVPLFDPLNPANTWRLRGGADFDFPSNQTLNPGAFAMLVSFNPTNEALLGQFRSRFNLSASVPVFGPYQGKLENSGGSVRLSRPDAPNEGELPQIVVDEVDYLDSDPWPIAADGIGASLQRKQLTQFGNDPINWAGGLSPGANYGGTPPALTSQSGNVTAVAGRTLTLNTSVTGTEPLVYQWRRNGVNLQGQNGPTLVITNVQLHEAGTYKLIVFNSAGSAESADISVTVLIPPRITVQPRPAQLPPGGTTNFTVSAISTVTNMTYQWLFNGEPIPNATGTTLTVSNVTLANDGLYSVLVTDTIDTVESARVRLLLLIRPTIVVQPTSQSVPAGSTAVLSISVTNTANLPIGFRWRRGGTTVISNVVNRHFDFLVIPNVQNSSNYNVGVYNIANSSGTPASSTVTVAALLDSDSDGIPDNWELQYGLQTNDLADASADTDGDGINNYKEYVAGTNPTDARSYLRVDFVTLPGVSEPNAVVSFPAVSNKTYTVEFANHIGAFEKLADVPARATNWLGTVVDPVPGTSKYYRIATPVQP